MRRTLTALALAAVACGVLPSVATASGGGIGVSYDDKVVDYDGVHHVVAECDANAEPGGSGDLAVVTSVTCTLNHGAGLPFVPHTIAAPGSKSAVVVTADIAGPVTLCRSGSVTYLDFGSNETYTADYAEVCVLIAS